jgi:hypothetical protein
MKKTKLCKIYTGSSKPKKNKEEKKFEKKNLSPGDGFSSGIV